MKILKKIKILAKELKRNVLVLWFAIRNNQTPLFAKVMAFFTVAYAFSPIDLIPDFIPVLGYLDELVLIPIFVWITLRLIPESVLVQSRLKAQDWLSHKLSEPKSYLGLFIVIVLWLLITWICIRYFFMDS